MNRLLTLKARITSAIQNQLRQRRIRQIVKRLNY